MRSSNPNLERYNYTHNAVKLKIFVMNHFKKLNCIPGISKMNGIDGCSSTTQTVQWWLAIIAAFAWQMASHHCDNINKQIIQCHVMKSSVWRSWLHWTFLNIFGAGQYNTKQRRMNIFLVDVTRTAPQCSGFHMKCSGNRRLRRWVTKQIKKKNTKQQQQHILPKICFSST